LKISDGKSLVYFHFSSVFFAAWFGLEVG